MTLSSLAPRRGELLWDIGAGSGSVAIEWMLRRSLACAPSRIEARADRAARIRRNAAAFGVPELEIVEGARAGGARELAAPDAVFIGGGASDPGVLDAAIAALQPGGRLVANAVTLETEALLIARHAALGGELTRIAIARADSVGGKTGWRAGDAGDAMAVGEAMIVAGIGCRKGARPPRSTPRSPRRSSAPAGRWRARCCMATAARKRDEAGIAAAAEARGLRLVFVAPAELEIASRARRRPGRRACWRWPACRRSPRRRRWPPPGRRRGSFCPRIVVGTATCALAERRRRRHDGAFHRRRARRAPTSSPCAGAT